MKSSVKRPDGPVSPQQVRGGGGHDVAPPSRRERAKARTRSALIRAAQSLIVEGRLHAPVLEITQAADVGLGSFYNHFDSREALLQAAVDDALEGLGDLLDQLSAGLTDPAEVLAQSFRLTGRLFRTEPDLMGVAMSGGPTIVHAQRGLVPRARRDLEAGIRAGRFTVGDTDLALAGVVGAALCLGELLGSQPDRDEGEATDALAVAVLRMLGVPPEEAARIVRLPLPDAAIPAGSGTPATPASAEQMRRVPLAETGTA